MKKQIWKYKVMQLGLNLIEMPEGATILSVADQDGNPTIWVLVNPDAPLVDRKVYRQMTGESFEHTDEMVFIGTFQHSWYVGHVFDGGEQ